MGNTSFNNYNDFRKFTLNHKFNGSYMSGNTFDEFMKWKMSHDSWQSPTIIEPTGNNFGVAIDVFSRLMKERIIFISSDIDNYTGSIVTSQMLYLNSQSDTDKISVYINSPGGSVSDGLSIYDTMMYMDAPLITCVTGIAASMASVLLAAGDQGKRASQDHARVMIHQASTGAYGRLEEIKVTYEQINSLNNELFNILARHCHQPIEKIYEVSSKSDYWLTSKEAKEFGIIDMILEPKKKIDINE